MGSYITFYPEHLTGCVIIHKNESADLITKMASSFTQELSPKKFTVAYSLPTFILLCRVNDLPPQTNFTIRLSAMTRTRRRGEENVTYCRTLPAPPDHPPRPRWRKVYPIYLYSPSLFSALTK